MAQWVAPVFVLFWSTGFIGAKLGLPYAEPMTFLAVRFAIVTVLLAAWAVVFRLPWPERSQWVDLALVGVLLHGVYLGGTFIAVSRGVEAGTASLIAGLQPVATALLARSFLGEAFRLSQWIGLVLGVLGVLLVVARKLDAGFGDPLAVGIALMGTAGIAVAQILQKGRLSSMPLVSGSAAQFAAAALFTGAGAVLFETGEITWSRDFIVAMAWLVLVLSVGAISLLALMLRRGEAGRVASLFFLVPAATAVVAYVMFGETLGWLDILGMVCAIAGVGLVMRAPDLRWAMSPRR